MFFKKSQKVPQQLVKDYYPWRSSIGGSGLYGDLRFNEPIDRFYGRLLSESVVIPSAIGDVKLISSDEFNTVRIANIEEGMRYYQNNPPFPELDKEDPKQDMIRIAVPYAKEIVNKGSRFLLGRGKFNGLESFTFENEKMAAIFEEFWEGASVSKKIPNLGKDFLRAGESTFYVTVRNVPKIRKGGVSIPDSIDGGEKSESKKPVELQYEFNRVIPSTLRAIFNQDKPSEVICWIMQYERSDGSYYREEIFSDVIYVYEGIEIKTAIANKDQVLSLLQDVGKITDAIVFELVMVMDHAEFGRFPLARFINDPDDADIYGTSVYEGNYGKYDRLNEIFTRALFATKNLADPLLWASGASGAEQDVHASDAVWFFENAQAALNVLEWTGVSDQTFKLIDKIEGFLYSNADVPRRQDLEKVFSKDLSGRAIRLLNSSTVDATNERRAAIEVGFRDLVSILGSVHKIPLKDQKFKMSWGPVFEEDFTILLDQYIKMREKNWIDDQYVIDRLPTIDEKERKRIQKFSDSVLLEQKELEKVSLSNNKNVSKNTEESEPLKNVEQKENSQQQKE